MCYLGVNSGLCVFVVININYFIEICLYKNYDFLLFLKIRLNYYGVE